MALCLADAPKNARKTKSASFDTAVVAFLLDGGQWRFGIAKSSR
jgi:hypothetical protein